MKICNCLGSHLKINFLVSVYSLQTWQYVHFMVAQGFDNPLDTGKHLRPVIRAETHRNFCLDFYDPDSLFGHVVAERDTFFEGKRQPPRLMGYQTVQ